MYIPKHFLETDSEKIKKLIHENSFGTLISTADEIPTATHLPFVFDDRKGEKGTLLGHLALANSQWKTLEGKEVLVIFNEAHSYISPNWFDDFGVPTWNYTAVHVYGKVKLLREEKALFEILEKLTEFNEKDFPIPWKPEMPEKVKQSYLKAIVGFEIEVTKILGKSKLSQNHTAERRKKIIENLKKSDLEDSRKIAFLMEEKLKKN